MEEKKKLKFVIGGRLASMNDYINKCRANVYVGNKFKKNYEDIVCIAIMQTQREEFTKTVSITYRFYEPNTRRDIDNINGFAHKVINDALQKMDIIKNDNQKYVKELKDYFYIDKENPRIEVEIMEV